jgi:Mlc titration factor MtfA (ptsG expression regulator)
MVLISFVIGLGMLAVFFIFNESKLRNPQEVFPTEWKNYLEKEVRFYNKLNQDKKVKFEYRVQKFLLNKKITGVKTEITYKEKLLVASSAVIPMFNFQEYYYPDLKEILIYPNHFDEKYQTRGSDRQILGMIGNSGLMSETMILSKTALIQGYKNSKDGVNVGIHEFIHVIDKSDHNVDGLPQILMEHDYAIPFLSIVEDEIQKIIDNKSELSPYGATNKAEFFAVASEFFFENPEKLKKRHPELFNILLELFRGN